MPRPQGVPTLADPIASEREEPTPIEDTPDDAAERLRMSARRLARGEPRTLEAPKSDRLELAMEGPILKAGAVGPKRIVVGKPAEYKVTIQNDGHTDARDVVVSIELPAWVDVAQMAPTAGASEVAKKGAANQTLAWKLDRLGAGAEEEITLEVISRANQPINLAVRWTYAQVGLQTQVEVEQPLLNMVIEGPDDVVFGETRRYALTISNPGTGDAENVEVNLLPATGTNGAVSTHRIGTLRNGETKTIHVELTAGTAGTLFVHASATADNGLEVQAKKDVLVRRAELAIEGAGPPAQYAGNSTVYRIQVRNTGNASSENALIRASLPAGAEFISGTHGGRWDGSKKQVVWDLGSFAAGQELVVELTCVLNAEGNTEVAAEVTDRSNHTAQASMRTEVIARADLKLIVSDPQRPVMIGEEAVYTLRITNRGTKAAEGIDAVVFFSEGIEPEVVEGATHEIGRGQVILTNVPAIPPGGELSVKIVARADRPGNHIFRSEVVCRALGTKLAAEETTHFYDPAAIREGEEPAPMESQEEQPGPIAPTPIDSAP